MVRRFPPELMLSLPSGSAVHPCRLIIRDGTLMWKQVLSAGYLPATDGQEAAIQKCALRLEELLRWLPEQDSEEHIRVLQWFDPKDPDYRQGSRCRFTHMTLANDLVSEFFLPHLADKEGLVIENNSLIFDLNYHID